MCETKTSILELHRFRDENSSFAISSNLKIRREPFKTLMIFADWSELAILIRNPSHL